MITRALGDVAHFYGGSSLPPGEPFSHQLDGYLLLRVSDLNLPNNSILVTTASKWTSKRGAKSATAPKNSLVIPKRGGAISTNKKRIIARECILDPNLMAVYPDENILDICYLYHWFQTFSLVDIASGSAVPQLNKQDLRPLPIPLPPIVEQRQIAAVLDQVDELRVKRRQARVFVDNLARSIFLDMFGNKSSRFDTVSVSDLATSIRTGPFGSDLLHSEFVDDGIAVLGIDNAVNNKFTWSQRRFITNAKYQKLVRYRVHAGDLLITIMGTCGRCAIVPDDIPVAINTKHLCCITLDKNRCLPEFLHAYFLMHPTARRFLERSAKGAIMSGLNATIIKSLPVQLPPFADQERFAKTSLQLREQKDRCNSQAQEFDELFKSLQQRAFRNEL